MTDGRGSTGRIGEEHALRHYLRLGFTPVARNARTRHGELDLIMGSDRLLLFAEVRTRQTPGADPLESFDARKALQVRRMAVQWLAANPGAARGRELRIDAVAVRVDGSGGLLSLTCLEGVL